MNHRTLALIAVLAACGLAPAQVAQTQPRQAQKVDHPRLRAALHELREARKWLSDAKDSWPPGYKDRALASTQSAMDTIRIMLAVKDVDAFVGVERTEDYYKKFEKHPRLLAALADLRDARDELKGDKERVGPLREEALDYIDMAVGDIVSLIRYKPKR